jgi:serine/threonine-protein kinase
MATVYKAIQLSMNRSVAIKVMEVRLSKEEDFLRRFEREARVVAEFSHPYILKVFDYGVSEDGFTYIVMELHIGGSLTQRILAGKLPPEQVLRTFDQIAQALEYAHERGILHRDLKPQNVLLDAKGNAFLTDFGIAKIMGDTTQMTQITKSGVIMGTPAYMAPEQWRGDAIDTRTDLYALGVMLFEMLTGKVPFNGNTPYAMMHKHIYESPPDLRVERADLPDALGSIISKALSKSPNDRYQSASEMVDALRYGLQLGFPSYQNQSSQPYDPTKTYVPFPPPTPETGRLPSPIGAAVTIDPPNDAPQSPNRAVLIIGAIAVPVIIGGVLFLANLFPRQAVTPTSVAALSTNISAPTIPVVLETGIPSTPGVIPTVLPTNTAIPPTATPIPPTLTRVPPTNTPIPSSATPLASTSTPIPPTPSRVPPTNTPIPSSVTPIPSTVTRLPPTNTPIPPTVTRVPLTNTPIPPTATRVPLTNTPIPPTVTRVPPTNTPIPPTATRVPPTSASIPPTGAAAPTLSAGNVSTLKSAGNFTLRETGSSIAFGTNTNLLAITLDRTVRLLNTDTGVMEYAFQTNRYALSTDAKQVAAVRRDGVLELWSLAPFERKFEIVPNSGVSTLIYHPNGTQLVTANGDRSFQFRNLADPTNVAAAYPTGLSGQLTSLTFSPNGRYLAVADSTGAVKIWDLSSASRAALRTVAPTTAATPLIVFAPNNTMLLIGSGRSVQAIAVTTGAAEVRFPATLHEKPIIGLAISQNGVMITAGSDNTVKFWNAQTGQLISTLNFAPRTLAGIALSPNNTTLVVSLSRELLQFFRVPSR